MNSESRFVDLFEKSFDTLFKGLHRYAYTLLKDNDEASDVVQLVFTKWWENKAELEGLEASKAYLFTAVYRNCLNMIRNKKLKLNHMSSYALEKNHETQFEDLSTIKELDLRIKSTIENLPSQCRIIFCKSRFEEKKYAQIANEMSLSIKTVEAHIGKALKILRENLEVYR